MAKRKKKKKSSLKDCCLVFVLKVENKSKKFVFVLVHDAWAYDIRQMPEWS